MVTLVAHDPCGLCGYVREAFMFPSMRINKRSMRSQGTHLVMWFGRCRECNVDTGSPPTVQWQLDQASAVKVEAYRLRRWPELSRETARG